MLTRNWGEFIISNTRAVTRGWLLAFIPVIAVIGLLLWMIVSVDSAGGPNADAPVATESPSTQDEIPSPQATVAPFLVEVEPIEEMPVREGLDMGIYMKEGPGETPVVADVVYLGTHDIYYAKGLLSDEGRVCLSLSVTDPEANPTVTGRATCASFAEFTQAPLVIDMGSWEIRWFADGRAEWNGI